MIPDGYSTVAPGKLASVVTYLEMRGRPDLRPERVTPRWQMRHVTSPQVEWYRRLFAKVGQDWLWFSRLVMAPQTLQMILEDSRVAVYVISSEGADEGLLELDWRVAGSCELAFFGLTRALQGVGAGRWLMNRAIELAFSRPIERFWVHTCTLDHPDALGFYLRSGFTAYERRVEVEDDPRLTGLVPPDLLPEVPIIRA